MITPPQKEHEWLQQLVGEWTCESECSMGPGQPPIKTQGTETVRSLGGLWVLCEGQGAMPDGGINHSVITLGYDPARQSYVGSFICSVMNRLWLYEGHLDATGKALPLNAEGPSFTDPTKMAKYQDVVEFKSADERLLWSQVQGEDGQWTRFMTATYRRKK